MPRISAILPALALALAASLSSAPADAQGFDFTGNFNQGPNAGTIAGSLVLSGFTPGATGMFSASLLTISLYPDGIIPSPEGDVATLWSLQTANLFSTVNGAITGWQFIAGTGTEYNGNSYLLCLNTGAGVDLPPGRVCPAGLNFVGLGGADNFAFNFGGAQGLTFAPSRPVPEPTTYALLATGLFALVLLRRRRRA
jgi:hypothetical protein